MKTNASITVIVLSRGLDALLRICLQLAAAALDSACSDKGKTNLVVVDNASAVPYDDDIRALARVIRFDTHHSFASACNRASSAVPASYYLLLNNDVLLHPQAIRHMKNVLDEHPQSAVCGARLVYPDSTIQHHGVVFGAGSRGPYHRNVRKPSAIIARTTDSLQAVTGACMLVRASALSEAGGLDESYKFGMEDIDLCLRLRQAGWFVFCCQQVDSLHFESMTPGRNELDIPSRKCFMERWKNKYTIDG